MQIQGDGFVGKVLGHISPNTRPLAPHQKPGLVLCICNPSTKGRMERGGSKKVLLASQSRPIGEFQVHEEACLQSKVERQRDSSATEDAC